MSESLIHLQNLNISISKEVIRPCSLIANVNEIKIDKAIHKSQNNIIQNKCNDESLSQNKTDIIFEEKKNKNDIHDFLPTNNNGLSIGYSCIHNTNQQVDKNPFLGQEKSKPTEKIKILLNNEKEIERFKLHDKRPEKTNYSFSSESTKLQRAFLNQGNNQSDYSTDIHIVNNPKQGEKSVAIKFEIAQKGEPKIDEQEEEEEKRVNGILKLIALITIIVGGACFIASMGFLFYIACKYMRKYIIGLVSLLPFSFFLIGSSSIGIFLSIKKGKSNFSLCSSIVMIFFLVMQFAIFLSSIIIVKFKDINLIYSAIEEEQYKGMSNIVFLLLCISEIICISLQVTFAILIYKSRKCLSRRLKKESQPLNNLESNNKSKK